jgi:hypothetical protein
MTDIEFLMIAEKFPTLKHGSTDDKLRFARAIEQASRRAALEEACAAIKAEDDRQNDNDYMLDSDDCIRVVRVLADRDSTIDAALAKQAKGV